MLWIANLSSDALVAATARCATGFMLKAPQRPGATLALVLDEKTVGFATPRTRRMLTCSSAQWSSLERVSCEQFAYANVVTAKLGSNVVDIAKNVPTSHRLGASERTVSRSSPCRHAAPRHPRKSRL